MVRRTVWLVLVALLAVAAPAAVRADGHPAPSLLAPSPEEAARQSIEAVGEQFAGLCSDTLSPRDIGKTCIRLAGEQGELRAYLAGRTFSEFSRWIFVERTAAGWRAIGTEPLDFFAQPTIPWPGGAAPSQA